jgi:acetyl esterase/lipase
MMRKEEATLEGIRVEQDVEYGIGGGRPLVLDVFRPEGIEAPAPAVVFIHGGGFRAGNKVDVRPHIAVVAKRGFVCVSISYRLSSEAKFPAQIEDAKCAVRWMRANADRLGIESGRIGAIGFSAGGTLAALLGVTGEVESLEGVGGHESESSAIKGAVSVFGVSEMFWMGDDNAAQELVGASREENPDGYAAASPITYVSSRSVPHLLLHGTGDPIVPFSQSVQMRDALQAAGVPVDLIAWPGQGHGFPWGTEMCDPSFDRIVEFFQENL